MKSLDGEKRYLKALKALAVMVKATFGETSQQFINVKQDIKEQQKIIKQWQNKVNSGEEKECLPDYSGTLPDQVQAMAEYDKRIIEKMLFWFEK
jgi:hypothetical protein